MKKIFYPVLLLVLAACKNPEQTSETIVPAPAIADIPTDTVTTQVDGITSATSKPNQVSFNGTIVLPPQRQATVALTMGGVVKHTSLLPGQQVRQGALLATLENPDFIALQQTYLDSHAQAEYLQAYTELTVGQVAQTVGYSTSSRFAELFRKSTGLLPLEYRKNAQRK